MAININSVTIGGRLTRDVEIRYTASGVAVCELSVATNRRYKQGDDWQEETTFASVTVWGKQAEACRDCLRKGSSVVVQGRLSQDEWDDKDDGKKRTKTYVTADIGGVHFADGKGGNSDSGDSRREPPRERATATPPQGRGYTAQDAGTPGGGGDDVDDDKSAIPFRFNDFDTTSEGVR